MKKYYYITPENEQRGPVEDYMLASCGVNSNTMVWTEGMANWMPAGQIPELVFFINTASSSSTPADGNFVPGARVLHDRFGSGIIERIEGSGLDAKATVRFDNVGVKVLLMRFARLTLAASS